MTFVTGLFHSAQCLQRSSISVVAWDKILPLAEQYSGVCVHHILFSPSSWCGHLSCSHLLTVVNNAAVHMGVQIPVWVLAFNSFVHGLRSGIAESFANPIFYVIL